MTIFFDYDGVLSLISVKNLCQELVHKGIKCVCLTTRNSKDMLEVRQACNTYNIQSLSLGDIIDEGLIHSKADYIKMIMKFQESESFLLIDNDPNEIIACLKAGIFAMMVPSYLSESLFDSIDVEELIKKARL